MQIGFAKEVDAGERSWLPRPLLHALIILGARLPGVGYAVAAVGTLTTAVVAAYLVTLRILRTSDGGWRLASLAVVAFGLSIATGIYAPMVSDHIYRGVGSPTIWHNPTQVVLAPLALGAFWCVERWLTTGARATWIAGSALLLGTVLVKPNFAIALIPALAFRVLARHRSRVVSTVGLVMPSVAVMALQHGLVFGEGAENGAGIALGLIPNPACAWSMPLWSLPSPAPS